MPESGAIHAPARPTVEVASKAIPVFKTGKEMRLRLNNGAGSGGASHPDRAAAGPAA